MQVSFQIIGQNIKNARKAHHLTQAQAAEKAGICTLHFGRIERGERAPSLKLLAQIAAALHTSMDVLLQDCIINLDPSCTYFESSDPQTRSYGEYALIILDEYREQIKRYYEELNLRENTRH